MKFNEIVNNSNSTYNLSSNGNYHKFTLVDDETNEKDGGAIIKIKMPTTDDISSIEKITITAKTYDMNDTILERKEFICQFISDGSGSKYSKNVNTSDIKIYNGTIQPTFNPDKYEYMITTDDATIDLEFLLEEPKTKIYYYAGDFLSYYEGYTEPKEVNKKFTLNLNYGENKGIIVLESEYLQKLK